MNTWSITDPETREVTYHGSQTYSFEYDLDGGLMDMLNHPLIKKALRDRENTRLSNIEWLDRDLREKEEKKNMYPIVDLRNIGEWTDPGDPLLKKSLDELINDSTPIYSRDRCQIWHCGHGSARGRVDESEQNKINTNYHTEGIQNNTCAIHHGTSQHNMKGNNTYKQYKNFVENAKKGDIIFTACSSKGGITHWGVYSGEIVTQQHDFDQWYDTYISVDKWIPMSIVKRGVGRNCTLYQVCPKNKNGEPTKNYENYLEEVREFLRV